MKLKQVKFKTSHFTLIKERIDFIFLHKDFNLLYIIETNRQQRQKYIW